MIPLNERHLRLVLPKWVPHYDRGRPHSRLALEFRTRHRSSKCGRLVTRFSARIVLPQNRSWEVSTTSTGLKRSRREFVRMTGLTQLRWGG